MEHRLPAGTPAAPAPLPPGRLQFEQVAAAALADGLIAERDRDRVRFSAQGARNASEVHPLVLLSNLKLAASEGGELSLERLTEWLARRTGCRYLRIDPTRVDVASVTAVASHAYARRHRFLPLAVDAERVLVATSEPLAQEWRRDLQHLTRRQIELAMVNPLDLHRYTMEFFGVTRSVRGARGDVRGEANTTLPSFEQLVELGRAGDVNADDQHIVHIVDWLLQYAYEQRASDIHLEPRREMGRMRFRIDGVLHKVFEVPPAVMTAVVSRIKVLGRMDLAERRRPQDGRIKTRTSGGQEIELRLSTMPTAFGEKLVMRIFDPDVVVKTLPELGFPLDDAQRWNVLTQRPHGIILVTGPTGSGKTTTLYTTLKALATSEVNVCTVEDPIEMIEGSFNQMQVQHGIDLSFADGIRALMRQDPDIIMIGEIRDLETAEMAIQAALTGHLVFSTLHTNSAPATIVRLLELGVPHYLLEATLSGIMAQRLVRTLCSHCKKDDGEVTEEIWSNLTQGHALPRPEKVYRPVGCPECRQTGFRGRTGLYELLTVSAAFAKLIQPGVDLQLLQQQSIADGMKPLAVAGTMKVMEGVTTVEEILKVTAAQG